MILELSLESTGTKILLMERNAWTLCLDNTCEDKTRFVAIKARNVVYATGGPGGIYFNSVYPGASLEHRSCV